MPACPPARLPACPPACTLAIVLLLACTCRVRTK